VRLMQEMALVPGGPRGRAEHVVATMIPPDRLSRLRYSSAWQGIPRAGCRRSRARLCDQTASFASTDKTTMQVRSAG
jgi:hypothetical protein